MVERCLSIPEVAKLMIVSRYTVYWWIRKGKLKAFRPSGPGGVMRVKESEFEKFTASGSPAYE